MLLFFFKGKVQRTKRIKYDGISIKEISTAPSSMMGKCMFSVEVREDVSLDILVVLFGPNRPVHYLDVVPQGPSSNPQL